MSQLGAFAIRNSTRDLFSRLPDETLDTIIAFIDDLDSSVPTRATRSAAWRSCSLVCKRWHGIVLPHLFRNARIVLLGPLPLNSRYSVPRLTTDCAVIARFLQVLDIPVLFDLDYHALDTLLGCLPFLRCLTVHYNTLGFYPLAVPENPLRSASHTLCKLVYIEGHREAFSCCESFVHLLALFSNIGELHVEVNNPSDIDETNRWPTDGDVDAFVEQTRSTSVGLRLRKFRCAGEQISGFFIPSYLLKLGVVNNLTDLTVLLEHKSRWSSLFDIILASSDTLTSLTIEFRSLTEAGTGNGITSLQPALSACASLEDLTLIAHPNKPPVSDEHSIRTSHPDGQNIRHAHIPRQYHWLALIELLHSMPSDSLVSLRRIKLGLPDVSTDPHALDWRSFSDWCSGKMSSKASLLRSIDVELFQAYDQRGCMAYEMGEFMREYPGVFLPRFNLPLGVHGVRGYDMQKAKELHCTGVEHECRNEECRRYRGACPVE